MRDWSFFCSRWREKCGWTLAVQEALNAVFSANKQIVLIRKPVSAPKHFQGLKSNRKIKEHQIYLEICPLAISLLFLTLARSFRDSTFFSSLFTSAPHSLHLFSSLHHTPPHCHPSDVPCGSKYKRQKSCCTFKWWNPMRSICNSSLFHSICDPEISISTSVHNKTSLLSLVLKGEDNVSHFMIPHILNVCQLQNYFKDSLCFCWRSSNFCKTFLLFKGQCKYKSVGSFSSRMIS